MRGGEKDLKKIGVRKQRIAVRDILLDMEELEARLDAAGLD